jgi:hypothetical protein
LNFTNLPISNPTTVESTIQGLVMRRILAGSVAATALTFAVSWSMPVLAADAEPTEHQIYEAATTGHLDQAQQMMDQVLRAHPQSAKAHFDQAELYAREGKIALARAELEQAEQLKPGLPDERPQSVEALKSELGLGARAIRGQGPFGRPVPSAAHFPWGAVLLLALVVGVFWMMFRRRSNYVQYPTGGAMPGGAPGGYGPGYGPGGGGVGSSIAGGLAGGLAAGAGIVAGEELAHHVLDGGQAQGGVIPPANAGENDGSNSDMGGADFGDNDPGSWDGGSSGGDFGGGGGGDWS